MIPPPSQSSVPQQQQQQQPESSSTLQSSTPPQAQTGAQQLQVTRTSPAHTNAIFFALALRHQLTYTLCLIHWFHCRFYVFPKLRFCFLLTHNSHYCDCPLFSCTLAPLHAAFSCMTLSLGPMIQVLLSCLLHSAQSIYTSSIRPHVSLLCRYSTEHKTSLCVGVCGSGVKHIVHNAFFSSLKYVYFNASKNIFRVHI